jgi:hypothetical protein
LSALFDIAHLRVTNGGQAALKQTKSVYLSRRLPGWCVWHHSRASRRDWNFIGSTSGPMTTNSPLISRIVSVVTSVALVIPVVQHDFRYTTGNCHAPRRR